MHELSLFLSHTHTHPHNCIHTPILTSELAHMHTHTCTRMHTHAHTHTHACTHMRTHMHTHAHTHAHACTHVPQYFLTSLPPRCLKASRVSFTSVAQILTTDSLSGQDSSWSPCQSLMNRKDSSAEKRRIASVFRKQFRNSESVLSLKTPARRRDWRLCITVLCRGLIH